MIIAISGAPGSGKSTLARMLADALGMPRYYVGGMRRELAQKHNMTLAEFNTLGEKEDWTDREVDEYQKQLGATEDNFIIEGRTSFFLIPHSFKIFIDVDPRVGAERVFKDLRKPGNARNEGSGLTSVEAVLESHQRRIASDATRYRKWYGVTINDRAHYDYWMDTTNLTPEQAFEDLFGELKRRFPVLPLH